MFLSQHKIILNLHKCDKSLYFTYQNDRKIFKKTKRKRKGKTTYGSRISFSFHSAYSVLHYTYAYIQE